MIGRYPVVQEPREVMESWRPSRARVSFRLSSPTLAKATTSTSTSTSTSTTSYHSSYMSDLSTHFRVHDFTPTTFPPGQVVVTSDIMWKPICLGPSMSTIVPSQVC